MSEKITITANGTSDAVLLPTGKANVYCQGASTLNFDSGTVTFQVRPPAASTDITTKFQNLKQIYIDGGTAKWATILIDGTNNGPVAIDVEPNSYLQFVTTSVASAADIEMVVNDAE